MDELNEMKRVFARYIGHVNLITGDEQFILSRFMGNAELEFIDNHIYYESMTLDKEPKVHHSEFEADFMELLKKHNINDLDGHISVSNELNLQDIISRTKTIEIELTGTIS